MILRRLVPLGAGVAALALLSASPSAAGPLDGVQWNPTQMDLDVGTAAPWEAVMASSGKGVAFAGRYYRDYDATTDTWGPTRILHAEPLQMLADGNAAGTACTTWSAATGTGVACRSAGSTRWVKKNLSRNPGAGPHSISVSRDGRRALIVWSDSVDGLMSPRATVYTLSGRKIRTMNLDDLPNPASSYMTAPTRLGGRDGFTLMYVTARPFSLGDQTFYRTYRPGSGWSGQNRIQFDTGGVPGNVYASDLASDGRRTYFAATTDVAAFQVDDPSAYAIARVTSQGTITQPFNPAIAMLRPELGVKGKAITLIGPDGSGAMAMALIEATAPPSVTITTRMSPTVGDTLAELTSVEVVGQSFAGGLKGAAIVAEYTGVIDLGTPQQRPVSEIFTLDVFYEGGVASLGPMTQLGTIEGDAGMQPQLAGHGGYAMTVYGSASGRYAAVRRPMPL